MTKAYAELKAEPMEASKLDQWLSGTISRRTLMVPFGGPCDPVRFGLDRKAAPLGVDVDGEWFSEHTDLYGPFPSLKASRERLVDWHHTTFDSNVDPVGNAMRGAIIGKAIMDDHPETVEIDGIPYAGVWADFWANAGEKRRQLVGLLERRGVSVMGSTQPVKGATLVDAKTGEITLWPVKYYTLSTSPQNTWAVTPPLKASLAVLPDDVGIAALKAAFARLNDLEPSLRSSFSGGGRGFRQSGDGAGKAGRVLSRKNEALVAEIAERAERLLVQLRKLAAAPPEEGTEG